MVFGFDFSHHHCWKGKRFRPRRARKMVKILHSKDWLVLDAYSACLPTDLIMLNFSFPSEIIKLLDGYIRLAVAHRSSFLSRRTYWDIKIFPPHIQPSSKSFFIHFYTTAAAFNPTPASSSASSFVFPLIKYMYAACVTRNAEKHWEKWERQPKKVSI